MHSTISINEPDFQISVLSTHTLHNDNDNKKTELILPCLFDSQLIRSMHFSFSGTIDHTTPVSPKDMLSSCVVQSFHRYLSLARLQFAYDYYVP